MLEMVPTRVKPVTRLRRLEYRRREGTGVPVWALTPYGQSVVAPGIPWLRPPAANDVGARLLQHTLLLNDLLLGLVVALRRSETAPLAELPFGTAVVAAGGTGTGQALLAHSDPRMTQRYTHLADTLLGSVVARPSQGQLLRQGCGTRARRSRTSLFSLRRRHLKK